MADRVAATPPADTRLSLHEARGLADALPELLIDARRVANTILAGWHGRRRAGPGESFWQFRSFITGEAAASVDWRRSARDDHLYVRETEWEAAHTLWLAPDLSPSMAFQSRLSRTSKRDRAALLTLALAEILSRSGERVGLLGETRAYLSRNAAVTLGEAMRDGRAAFPEVTQLRRHTDVILIGDFLDPMAEIDQRLAAVAATGAGAHLVQIVDPIEETFPYVGRTEVLDPETGRKHMVGRAESYRADYGKALAALRDHLRDTCRKLDWTFIIHRTDRPATEPLLLLHARLSDRGSRYRSARMGRVA
jgi:uncharacterized protein (DUF58 family)